MSKFRPAAKAIVPPLLGLFGALGQYLITGHLDHHAILTFGVGLIGGLVTYFVPNGVPKAAAVQTSPNPAVELHSEALVAARTPLISFEDAVTASNLDPNQKYAVYYADGRFANRTAVAARCPRAKLFGITVHGLTGAGVFACDCEQGDLTPAQAEAWVAEQVRLGVKLICVYASLDTWVNQGLKAALDKYGSRIKRWVAHFNNVPQIPSWADAEQFADPGPVDKNVALANFFGDVPAPDKPHGVAKFEGSVDFATGVWTIKGLPGTAHFAGPKEWMSAEIQIDRGSDSDAGHWRIHGMPLDAAPLGR